MQREDYLATLILIAGLLAATLSGYLREATLAHQLGTGREADIYLIAFSVPEFVIIALAIILPPAFIPLFTGYRREYGEEEAWRLGVRVFGSVSVLLILVAALAIISAPIYLRWLAPGFNLDEFSQTVRASRFMMPAIILMGCGILIGAVLQVYRRFESTALTNLVYNLAFVAVLLAAPIVWLVGNTALGVILGASAAFLIQIPFLWKHRLVLRRINIFRQAGRINQLASKGISEFSRLAGPLTIGYAVHHTIWFVDRAMATTLGVGSVATLNYAYRLSLVVGQLSGLAVSTAVFPRIAEQADSGDDEGLQSSLSDSLRFVWMIGLPATCAIILLRKPIVQVLYQHGAFGQASANAVSEVVAWYALAVFADAMCQPFWRVIYAWRKVWTVSGVNGLQTTVRIFMNIVLIRYFGYLGIAISALVGLTVQVLFLGWLIQRRLGMHFVNQWWQDARLVILATFLASFMIAVLARQLLASPAIVALVVSGVSGVVMYFLVIGFSKYWRRIHSGIKALKSPNGK